MHMFIVNIVNKINIILLVICIGAAVANSSCNAGFDNSRVKSLNIEARTYYQEGTQYSSENRTDEAIQAFTKSIEAGPSAVAYNARATEYNRKGRIDDAMSDANRAILLNEKYAPVYFTRGNSCYKKGDYDRALKDFSRSIILDPEQPRCYFNLAQTYTRMGLTDEAIDMYEKSIQRDPGYYPAHYNRACLYAQKNRPDRAIESLELAIKNGLCNPELLRREKSFDALRKTARFKQLSDRLDRIFKSSTGCRRTGPE
jgi:tetratricopeptide (TPR) repeat protein